MGYFFSIIIPCYNTSKFINRTLDSILNQDIDVKNDIEVIIIDDLSTDNFLDLVEPYKEKMTIRVFTTKPGGLHGPGQSRNIGLANAKGKYITFLDHDDYFILNTFGKVKSEIKDANYPDYIITNYQQMENGDIFEFNGWVFLHGKFYLNDYLKRINIKFNKNMRYDEDTYFQSQILFDESKTQLIIPLLTYVWGIDPIYSLGVKSLNSAKDKNDKDNIPILLNMLTSKFFGFPKFNYKNEIDFVWSMLEVFNKMKVRQAPECIYLVLCLIYYYGLSFLNITKDDFIEIAKQRNFNDKEISDFFDYIGE